MKGLLIKDLQLLKSLSRSFIPGLFIGIAFIFYNGNASFSAVYLTIILSTITYSTISYDQYANGMGYLLTLPVSRSSYVKEKYLLHILVTILSLIVTVFVTAAGCLIRHDSFGTDLFVTALLSSLVMAVMTQSVMTPLLLKFGAEKSRFVIVVILGIGYLIGFSCYFLTKKSKLDFSGIIRRISEAGEAAVVTGICVFLIAAAMISFLISLHIMRKKEF